MEEEKQEKGFVIKDRRHFDESGDLRTDVVPGQGAAQPEGETDKTPHPDVEVDHTGRDASDSVQTEADSLPEVTFANFIFSLSTTAMYHFGDLPDPATKESRKNLAAAKQTIDILSMLSTKTQGNLDEGEKGLLDGILYELRMRFVKEAKKL